MARVLPFVFLIITCTAFSRPGVKIAQPNRDKISVEFRGIQGTDRVLLSYSLRRNSRTGQQVIRSGNVYLQQKSAGYFSETIRNEVPDQEYGLLEYFVKAFSNKGDVVDELHDSFVVTRLLPLETYAGETHRYSRSGMVWNDLPFQNFKVEIFEWTITPDHSRSGKASGQFQMYTPDTVNTFIRNGVLYLKPALTADKFGENFLHHGTLDVKKEWGSCTYSGNSGCHRHSPNIPPIMSSEIHSKVTMTHGKVEVVAQIPKGDWLWPAIWLRAEWPLKYGDWPASGEIDIMETRGNDHLRDNHGNDKSVHVLSSTIHWGASHSQHKQHREERESHSGTTWADSFHKYTLDWTADHIRMDVDDHPIMAWTTPSQGYWDYSHLSGHNIWRSGGKDAPFDSKMGLILNIAVGATNGYFPDNWYFSSNGKPWKNTSPTAIMDFWNNRHQWQPTWQGDDVAMKVKSVRMIQY